MLRLSGQALLVCLLLAASLPRAFSQAELACNSSTVSSAAWSDSSQLTKVAANHLLLFPLPVNASQYGLPAYSLTLQLGTGHCGHRCPVVIGRMGLYSAAGALLNQTSPFAWDSEYQTTVEAAIADAPLLPDSSPVYVGISSDADYWLLTTQAAGGYKVAHKGSGESSLPVKFVARTAVKLAYTAAFQLAICDS